MDELIFHVLQGSSMYQGGVCASINSADLRGRGVCLWSVLNCGPTCVCKCNMMRVPFGEQRARPTDRLGCDANATGVLCTPYMCTAFFPFKLGASPPQKKICCFARSIDTTTSNPVIPTKTARPGLFPREMLGGWLSWVF